MKIKSLALVAAAVMTAGAAQAADLNKPAKVAVDYVKVCDAYGTGFFYIPGSDTCLQISGYSRFRIATGSANNYTPASATASYAGPVGGSLRSRNAFYTAEEIELDFDARSQTQFGLLRAYNSIEVDFNTGGGSTINLNKGYLQWGGLTAGRAESMFEFYFGTADQINFAENFPDQTVNLIAYTFTFGNGVTGTISIEDSTTSTRNVGSAGTVLGALVAGAPGVNGGLFSYGGNKAPDVVANLNVTQAWGAAQVSGALHQDYGSTAAMGSKWGYGLLAGVKFNLPTLGAGDSAGIQAVYTSGDVKMATSDFITDGNLGADAVVNNAGTGIVLTKAWGIGAGIDHHFSPTVDLAINGGFTTFDGYLANDYTDYNIGTTLTWAPVKGLTIGGEVEYHNIAFTSATKTVYGAATGLTNANAWVVGLQVKRSFD